MIELQVLLVVSFLLISLGYGFCKPNIAPFGADQLQNMAGDYLQMFYFWFYFFSNVGALLAFAFSFFQVGELILRMNINIDTVAGEMGHL